MSAIDYQDAMAKADKAANYRDMDPGFWDIAHACADYTMTSVERMFDLYKSVEYVVKAGVPGAIVECGVWRGGSMMLAALTLKKLETDRWLYLFDTFEGHPKGQDRKRDVDIFGGVAADQWEPDWAKVDIEDVRANLKSTGYEGPTRFVKGRVEETLADNAPLPIAIARLDTDWYEGAKVELEVLWPRLSKGGLLIVDDFGHYDGQRQAVDEYFADKPAIKLTRIDYSCRVVQK